MSTEVLVPAGSSPQPQLSSVAPAATTTGSGDTPVTLSGSGFTSLTVVSANGAPISTTFVKSAQITAVIPANLLASSGVLQIEVSTPAPGGGSSGPLQFTVVNEGKISATVNPLVASYSLAVPRDANVLVEFGQDTTYAQRTWSQPTPSSGGQVDILVAGMKGSVTYHLRAVADFLDGTEYVGPDQTFTTGDISSLVLPKITVSLSGVGQPNPGVESLEANPLAANDPVNPIVITDLDGNVIWYYAAPEGDFAFPIKLLPNGHFIVNIASIPTLQSIALREIDLAGNTVREMDTATLNQRLANAGFNISVATIHHDFALLPNGHTILLANLYETVNRSTGPVTILGDVLIDIDENWQPVWVWNTFDHLDVNRIVLDPSDWTHGNAVIYTPDDGNLIYSSRNQSWVMKIDYENGAGTGDILWTSGYQGDLALTGNNPAQWHYGQHYPWVVSPQSAGVFQMAVYDDGNDRVLDSSGTICGQPTTPPCYSRGVIYSIDETNNTATELWEDNLSPIFTGYIGSVQQLPNGDVEIDAGVANQPSGIAEIFEVTHTTPPQIVWQMNVDHPVYRGLRMPSLYPGVQW